MNRGYELHRPIQFCVGLCLIFLITFPLHAEPFNAKVVGIHDGDTITVLRDVDGQPTELKIRLEGIDAPELDQPHGQDAKTALSKACFAKHITVKPTGTDRYDRTLATLHLPDHEPSLNLAMVRAGHAWWYEQFSDDANLREAEQHAREKRRGLWRHPNPIPPWEHRAGNQQSSDSIETPAPSSRSTFTASDSTSRMTRPCNKLKV